MHLNERLYGCFGSGYRRLCIDFYKIDLVAVYVVVDAVGELNALDLILSPGSISARLRLYDSDGDRLIRIALRLSYESLFETAPCGTSGQNKNCQDQNDRDQQLLY